MQDARKQHINTLPIIQYQLQVPTYRNHIPKERDKLAEETSSSHRYLLISSSLSVSLVQDCYIAAKMTPGVSAPPPAGKDQSESNNISNSCPPPPPRNNRPNENRNKRKIVGNDNHARNFPSPQRNYHHRGRGPGDVRNNRGRGPPGRHFQRDRRNMNGPGFRHNHRGMNNGPMGPGPNNLPPPPPNGRRMNHNGSFGPSHHGPAQRIPPPPPNRMGNGNGNGGQMYQQIGRGAPPPPPPQQGGRRMNQNYGQSNFQGPQSFHQPPRQQQQQQYFQQHQNIPNGPNQQLPYQYPHHGTNQKIPSYQSMGNQPLAQHSLPQPSLPAGQMQHGISSSQIISHHQPMMGASVVSSNPSEIAANWSTHKSPKGDDYFYNSVTKESTYTRPTCLGGPSIANNAVPGNAFPVAAPQASLVEKRSQKGWTKHTDTTSGKVYYYNGTITTWEKPDDFEDPSAEESSAPPSAKRKKKDTESPVLYNNKEEAIAAFKGLLLAKDISPTMKWNEVVKICSPDHRWEACSTTGERKQSLAEYQTKRANALREEKRQEKMRAKDAFMSLLTDVLPSISAFNASVGTPFQEIRDSISKDDRFHAVEQEERREELYLDFVEEVRKKDERQRRGRKREAKEAFLTFLKLKELLTFTSTWSSFLKTLDEKEKVDKSFVVSTSMSDSERQLYFADYVIELTAIEDEKRRRVREARRRAEKAQRNAFRETLKQYAKDGKIVPSSRWRNVEEAVTAEDTFNPVKEQDRNEPRNIFDDFIDEWAEIYHGDKAFLNSLLSKSKDLILNADTKYEDFTKALLDAAAYSPDAYSDARRVINEEIPISSAKLFFDETVTSGKFGSTRGRSDHHGKRIAGDSSEDEGEIIEDGELLNASTVIDTKDAGDAGKQDPSEAKGAEVEVATKSGQK